MTYEIMEYTPSTKCSDPSESANSHIIIITYWGKAIPILLLFKFLIQIPQIMNTKPFSLLCDPVLVLDWREEMSAFFQERKISLPQA